MLLCFDTNGDFALCVCRWNRVKLSKAQRMARVQQRKAAYMKKLEEEDE